VNNVANDIADEYLLRIKAAKNARAVLKVDFAAFASAIPDDTKIFAFEGPADKAIFYHWIKAVNSAIKYESHVCKNKFSVLQLFDSLQSDLTGLAERAYFFVDRDFDGLQGRDEHERVFITAKYSIENYVVCNELLDALLTVEFHCNGHPKVRESAKAVFEETYRQFLRATADLNFRIFASRRLGINQVADLPNRLNLIAEVELTKVTAAGKEAAELVQLEREPLQQELASLREIFDALKPEDSYRGKFALLFFVRWLGLLREDRVAANPVCLVLPATTFNVGGGFSLESLASKAPIPPELCKFLSEIK